MKEFFVKKASGESALFSEEKLRRSLQRVGASTEQINGVINEISDKLYDGITTRKIYRLAFNLLKGSSQHLAAKYHLKSAIMELGPSGYPFEKYIGEIFRHQDYAVETGKIIQGTCVKHEIDVIAKRDNIQFMIECKYHNQNGIFCDVKIPLYIQSRFKDVESQWLKSVEKNRKYQGVVVTNTRFSSDAIQYGTCAGLKLIGWDYPLKGSLKDMVDTLGLYPITCLTSLSKIEKQRLLDRNIVLCKELESNKKLLEEMGIKISRMDNVLQETHLLCKHLSVADKK
jgi:hypothetical protein